MSDTRSTGLLKSKNIILTGGRGFIGARLEQHLKQLGANVIKLDRETCADSIAVDFNNPELMKSVVQQINSTSPIHHIFHLAGQKSSSACKKDSLNSLSNTTNSTLNLLEACKDLNQLNRIILISSIGVYGSEEDGHKDLYTEANPPKTESIYSSTKVITESLGLAFAKEFKVPTLIVRLSNVYGPNQPMGALIPDLISQMRDPNAVIAMGSDVPIKDFIHIDDILSGLTSLITTKNIGIGEIFNLCSGEKSSVKQILDRLVKYTKFCGTIVVDPNKIRPNEKLCLVGSNAKLRSATYWRPSRSLEEGLRELCQIMKQK
ncbi:NAD(P)-dependent oxidoreductase [Polynucleobacter sp. AP-Melu-500A-A1]|uniref:NAD-dependent epimerase/dehydratase family protein n=1 Tax=Polynucleobacter sp. AP-Melu-500A-A1 TaxID=2576929 RepID=UPI001C0C2588|nr:NAD(P)-dependent oxidoreductase [Polynucleobacter sp. AP-Melu-500A-A1]MBU3630090.1 NAD(P)-dependent oxidoreductase [Polynucleobacter sp. AP-Melu-500A-A1]